MKPIFVAIDTPDPARARQIATAVRDHAGGIKLGLEFFSARGPDGVRRIAELGLPIFLDLKFHDIPNTVAKAVEAIAPLEPAILTVHAAGGHEMMLAAKRAAPPATKVVAVTLLTSLDTLGGADPRERRRRLIEGEQSRLVTGRRRPALCGRSGGEGGARERCPQRGDGDSAGGHGAAARVGSRATLPNQRSTRTSIRRCIRSSPNIRVSPPIL